MVGNGVPLLVNEALRSSAGFEGVSLSHPVMLDVDMCPGCPVPCGGAQTTVAIVYLLIELSNHISDVRYDNCSTGHRCM